LIICSCNVLSEAQILAALQTEGNGRPRSAGEAYRCLGCAPRCGRCVETVRALVAKAHLANCLVGCASCPAGEAHRAVEPAEPEIPFLIAAE
jgi:bacterioferritin-associated ferredoxin